jgi:hypothetical protein
VRFFGEDVRLVDSREGVGEKRRSRLIVSNGILQALSKKRKVSIRKKYRKENTFLEKVRVMQSLIDPRRLRKGYSSR